MKRYKMTLTMTGNFEDDKAAIEWFNSLRLALLIDSDSGQDGAPQDLEILDVIEN